MRARQRRGDDGRWIVPSLADYLALVPPQHASKPRFVASLVAALRPLVHAQAQLAAMPALFDLNVAVGAQLDAVGLWIGRGRDVTVPVEGLFFAWGTEGRGWGQGYWRGPFDTLTGLVRLDDASYRTLLRAKVLSNRWDGTVEGAGASLDALFPAGQQVFLQDNFDMTVTYAVAGVPLTTIERALFTGGYIQLKPAGVRVAYVDQTTANGTAIFGFGPQSKFIAGFEQGSWAAAGPAPT